MTILQKLNTAFRGGVREMAETVIDANNLRILGQEIYDCEQDINRSKQKLAFIIAEKMQVNRELDRLIDSNKIYEQSIVMLLGKGDEARAVEMAQRIAEQDSMIEQKQSHFDQLQEHEQSLQGLLKKMVVGLERFKNEYKMAKATANRQQAQAILSKSSPQSRFNAMQESLDRVQEKQQGTSDQMDAMAQVDAALSTESIDSLNPQQATANDILQRIKAKQKETTTA
ncbi:MAG: PspA/IM30 family protein [Cocleimonas sp.]|nr:PspA/IM30 family protein [Cocleimonas sp.]